MDLHLDEVLGKITDFMKTEANTDTVIGKEFQLGQFKCVPVIKVGMGFGSGGGEGSESKGKKGEGMGAGAGVGIEPMGFLVAREGEISFIEAGKAHGLSAAFEKVPDLIEKIIKEKSMKAETA